MATILGLALKINADASGVPAALTPVEKALQGLDREAAKVTGVFDRFSQSSAAAAEVQQRFQAEIDALTRALEDRAINGQQFADGFAAIRAEAAALADTFAEGARVTEANRTAEDRRAETLQRLDELLKAGAISEETYSRAKGEASGATAAAAKAEQDAERQRAALVAEAARVTESVTTEQQKREAALERLNVLLADGLISEETYQRAVEKTSGASAAAEEAERQRQSLLEEGRRVADSVATAEEKRGVELQKLQRLLDAGVISQETYARASAEASGANAAAAQAERDRADISARAARVLEQNLTASERAQNAYNAEIAEYQTLLRAGAISQEDFNKAVDRSAQSFAKATIEAGKTGTAIDAAGKGGTLQFNELSGILSALPGPLGSVAGRFSGLASAGEGLSRVFSGGLSAGISGVGASVAALVNPFTLAVAGVAAFGAGALAVVRGLTALDDRVEKLGNTADKLGVSFEFIQTIEEAAERSGTSIDAVSAAFGRLQKSVLGVDEESKAAQKALSEIGVTAEELQQLSPEQQYQRIGVALASIEDPARRTATATNLFGKAGADLIPFFNNLPGAATDIERFGRVLSDLDRGRIDSFGAGLDALAVATRGLGTTLLLPFTGLGETLARSAAEITAVVTSVADAIGRLLGPALRQIGSVVQTVASGIGLLTPVFRALAQAAEPVAEFILPAVVAQMIAINRTAIAGTITSLARSFSAAATAAVAYATSSGVAAAGTTALAVSIRGLLASTGVGALVVGAGLAATALAEWAFAADDAAEGTGSTAEATGKAAETAATVAAAVEQLNTAVENSRGALDSAIAKAGQFGQAGFDAAFQFQEALADLKEQADANELNAEQYSRGVALATAEFDKQIERLQKIQDETRKAAEEAQKRVDADRQVADALLEQARINSQFGGDASRARAADAVLAVEREVARLQEQVAADRNAGNTEAAAAGEERIRQLTLIAQQQGAIADGSAKAAADEAKRVEDQKKRVDSLIAASDTRSELEQQLIDVQEQQKLTLDQLILARQTFNREQADAAAGRLAQLDQLQAKLEDQQQAVEQGFGQGFAQAFQETDKGIDDLIVKAEQFGNVGALAAQALEQGIAQAQAQVRDGILTRETYEREVAQQRDIFEQRLQAANRVEEFLRNGVDARRQAELKATEELEKRKKEAAVNVQAIEAKLIEERKVLEELREKGDLRGARAAQTRVAALERAQRGEQALADGRLRQQNQIGQQFLTGLGSAQQFQNLVAQQNDNFLRAFSNTYAGANQALAANAAAAQQQAAKLERLLTPSNQLATTADIRTAEGQQLLIDVANQGLDPALVESRLQTKQLNLIAQGITQAAANYFNSPVAIVGGARIG